MRYKVELRSVRTVHICSKSLYFKENNISDAVAYIILNSSSHSWVLPVWVNHIKQCVQIFKTTLLTLCVLMFEAPYKGRAVIMMTCIYTFFKSCIPWELNIAVVSAMLYCLRSLKKGSNKIIKFRDDSK